MRVKKQKPSRMHPFVAFFEHKVSEYGFTFYSIEYENRFVTFLKRIDEDLFSFIELQYQPDTRGSYFSVKIGVKSYYMQDAYNNIQPWACRDLSKSNIDYIYPIAYPITVANRNLTYIRKFVNPTLPKKLDYGYENYDVESQVDDLINDYLIYGVPFLDKINSHSNLIEYLECLEQHTMPSEINSFCWGGRDFVLIFMKCRLGDFHGALINIDIWKLNEKATIERNFSSQHERKLRLLNECECECSRYQQFVLQQQNQNIIADRQ